MTVYRCILPAWAAEEDPDKRRVLEGQFSEERLKQLNDAAYNTYFLPNYPSEYVKGTPVEGSQIDTFRYVFADCDLKDKVYPDKQTFIDKVLAEGPEPTLIVDSGWGIHAYWQVSDLDAMSYLKLQRRIMRKFNTDEAVGQIYQLMRVPGTMNTKVKGNFKPCEHIHSSYKVYTCEEMDAQLPVLTTDDEEYCKTHFNKTYKLGTEICRIDDKIPLKFSHLVTSNREVKDIWSGLAEDRSKADYRLAHIMFANEFTKAEAMSVLVNSPKAIGRAPVHQVSYAQNIVDKIWTFEITQHKEALNLSSTVREILCKHGDSIKGERFPCHRYLDDTVHGFRLGQVIGLVAGSGVGKTAVALNMFMGFVKSNPNYEHFFIPLEQPANEIADRWKTMCGDNTALHDKVHVLSNYGDDGSYRNLSLGDIKDYLMKFKRLTGKEIGAVVIDHIGALKKNNKDGRQSIEDICHQMKAFAVETNTMLVMQSQAPREKAGIGDLDLGKDSAYGTVFFESYCDYLITIHQPLKRCYAEGAPTVTGLKFCKVRHKKQGQDRLQEDVPYRLFFDPVTEHLRELTQDEETSFNFFHKQCINKRKQDRKTDLVEYTSIKFGDEHGANNKDSQDTSGATRAG